VGANLTDETKLAALGAKAGRFEPKMDPADRDRKLAAWRKAVRAVVAFYAG
jgi:glycerol kinase